MDKDENQPAPRDPQIRRDKLSEATAKAEKAAQGMHAKATTADNSAPESTLGAMPMSEGSPLAKSTPTPSLDNDDFTGPATQSKSDSPVAPVPAPAAFPSTDTATRKSASEVAAELREKQAAAAAQKDSSNDEKIFKAPTEAPAAATPAPAPTTAISKSTPPPNDSELQVLAPAAAVKPLKPVSKWAFWKKGSQRDEQLTRISEGYVELIHMVRSIRDQADAQHENNMILRDSLIHLPGAIKGLEGFGKSHEQVGFALEKINDQMAKYSEKDELMAKSMDGFNNTLIDMNQTSKATIKTFDRVQDRMSDSDTRMENLFTSVRASEEKVSDTMMRLQRNNSILQGFFILCLLGVIGGLVYVLMNISALQEKFATPAQRPATEQGAVLPNSAVDSSPPAESKAAVTEKEESTPEPTPDAGANLPVEEIDITGTDVEATSEADTSSESDTAEATPTETPEAVSEATQPEGNSEQTPVAPSTETPEAPEFQLPLIQQ